MYASLCPSCQQCHQRQPHQVVQPGTEQMAQWMLGRQQVQPPMWGPLQVSLGVCFGTALAIVSSQSAPHPQPPDNFFSPDVYLHVSVILPTWMNLVVS